jgi:hypothetical protein
MSDNLTELLNHSPLNIIHSGCGTNKQFTPILVSRDCSVTFEWFDTPDLVFRDSPVTLKWDIVGRRSGDRLDLSEGHRVPSGMSCLLYCDH